MARIWMKTIKNHKIVENRTAPCEFETAPQVLGELLREADIARPLWLDKHLKEWARFQRTAFLPEHFVEDVRFDRLATRFEKTRPHRCLCGPCRMRFHKYLTQKCLYSERKLTIFPNEFSTCGVAVKPA